jgi:hypothetical protein
MRRASPATSRRLAWALAVASLPESAALQAGEPNQLCLRAATGLTAATCIANDARIAALRLAGPPRPCTSDTLVTVDLEIRVVSSVERFDVGLWIHQFGGSALTDSQPACYREALVPVAVPAGSCDHTGDLPAYYDGDGDSCGDLYASDDDVCGNAVAVACGTGEVDPAGECVLTRVLAGSLELACVDSDLDLVVDTGVCTSWDVSATMNCSSLLDAAPTTGSRCSCSDAVPVQGLIPSLFTDGFESEDTSAWSSTVPEPPPAG